MRKISRFQFFSDEVALEMIEVVTARFRIHHVDRQDLQQHLSTPWFSRGDLRKACRAARRPSAFLCQAMRNAGFDWCEKNCWKWKRHEFDLPEQFERSAAPEMDPESILLAREEDQQLNLRRRRAFKALEALPRKCRSLVRMKIEGMSNRQIALVEKKTENAVSCELRRVYAAMRTATKSAPRRATK